MLGCSELSQEWQKVDVVVKLDVKKAVDHVEHRAAFKAMRLQSLSLFSMALIAAIRSGICMQARLGTVHSNTVQMSRGLPQGALESPVIFTMISKSSVESGRLRAGSDLLCRRCGSGSGSGGGRSDRKIKRSGTDSWRREKTLDKPSEDGGLKCCGGWLSSVVGRSVGICGVSGRKCATCDCAQNSPSKQMLHEMANCVEFIMAPEETALENREIHLHALSLAGLISYLMTPVSCLVPGVSCTGSRISGLCLLSLISFSSSVTSLLFLVALLRLLFVSCAKLSCVAS